MPDFSKYGGQVRDTAVRWFAYAEVCFEGRKLSTDSTRTERQARGRKLVARTIFALLFAASISWIVSTAGPRHNNIPELRAGEIADTNVFSPITIDLEPRDTPLAGREEIAKRVAPVFDYDDGILDAWLQNWKDTFRRVRDEYYGTRPAPGVSKISEAIDKRIQEYTGARLSGRTLAFLQKNRFSVEVEKTFVKSAEPLLGRLIAPSDLFPSYYSTGILVRQVNQGLQETLVNDVSRIWSLDNARDFLRNLLASQRPKRPDRSWELRTQTTELLIEVLIANLKFNGPATQKRVAAAIGASKQNLVSIRRGDPLVRRGEKVTAQQAQLLEELRALLTPAAWLRFFLIGFLTLSVLFLVLFRFDLTKRSLWRLPIREAVCFFATAILAMIAAKYALPYLRLFLAQVGVSFGVEYLLPVATGGLLIHLTMGKEAAFTYAIVTSVGAGFLLDRSLPFMLWCLAVNASAIQSIRSCKQRSDLYRCALWSGLVGAALVASFALTQAIGFQQIPWQPVLTAMTFAFLSGLLATAFTSLLIPVAESVFGFTTNLKLLELANFNHPLLHELMLKAPGTYHHSVIVGSLAEIAADAVRANALLARVSAYYHDIGKMTKPLYFIENQAPNSNPHDELAPTMSAKILHSHVKHGVRLGREHKLGAKILEIIEQHHGTTLTSFFYTKAKRAEKPDNLVSENDFRYPGPRPQSREAAIVMICDSCEAATRTIADPSPAKIQGMVQSIIQKRLLDTQFHECDLTLADLQKIEEAVSRTLVSLYHHRIEYPGQPTVQRSSSGPSAAQS